jgi:hypothetical protein
MFYEVDEDKDEQYFVSTGVWNIVMPDMYIELVEQLLDFLG